MAERAENRHAIALLECFDAALLRDAECWFGGGTAVSLRCGEFRVSRDVDFLCASSEGYRLLRDRARTSDARGLFKRPPRLLREARVDRYGIRMAVEVDGAALKVEIVSEGRIALVGVDDPSLPVGRLSDSAMVAEKLLANDDRYLDDSTLGRDAIDLIALEHYLGALPEAAWETARGAYGASVDRAWATALQRMRDRPATLARALREMDVLPEARAQIEARIAALPATDEG